MNVGGLIYMMKVFAVLMGILLIASLALVIEAILTLLFIPVVVLIVAWKLR